MPERILLTTYTPITAANGDPITTLVTPNSRLTSKDRHVTARSTGATIVARSSGRDVFARGGTQPLVTPKSPLLVGERGYSASRISAM